MFVAASNVNVRNVVAFNYNGDTRCLLVEKVTPEYMQGKCLPWEGVLPSHRFASFRFDRMQSNIELVEDVGGYSELSRFDLADVR
jgi:hypothetical protein